MSIALALPNRSIAIARNSLAPPAGFLFTIIILGGLFAFFAVWQGPALWRDIQISQDPLVLHDGRVLDGECTTRRGLTDCEARLVYDYDGRSYEKSVALAFLDFSSGDYEVEVVVSRADPELATITLGLDMLWNRIAVLAVFSLIFVGGVIAMIVQALRAWGANRAATASQRLSLVPVELTELRRAQGGQYASYVDHPKGTKSRRIMRSRLGRGQEPLMAVDENGAVVAVAVKAEHVAMPILLDRGLERLELSAEKRAEALAAFEAQQAERGSVQSVTPPKRKLHILRGILVFFGIILLAIVGVLGYWLYYVTNSPDAFDDLGMEINNLMPEPVNLWGCQQLEARFGDSNAPFGCTANDYVSWKTAAPGKIKR